MRGRARRRFPFAKSHTLGAYFHHRALLTRMRYWERVFPKDAEGRRRGAPDCYLHDYLEGNGCQKIVPERLLTFHFLNGEDAQAYRNGKLATQPGARALVESGQAVREALAGVEETVEPAPSGAPAAEPPLVSAVMISGKCPEREPLARVAVAMFLEQTHPRKELIIVNHGGAPLEIGHPEVQEILVPAGCRVTLGDLRNLALCAAAGEWIIQWDDDDWHAPERMAVQLRHAATEAAVLLRSQIRYNLQTGTGYVLTLPQGIDGTILHSRKVLHRYPSLRRAEDTEFLKGFAQRKPITNAAGLYVRFYHGANTWEEKHLMHRHTGQRGELHLGPADRALLLERVLPRYAAVGMEMGVEK